MDIRMKKAELLAPAGSYESFLGAIHAGADAVYLGGKRFGARAYADNFTEEEICRAVRYAHIYNKRVYLTLNTLVKEREFGEIYDYLLPLYQAGLDGVIIQDLGVFRAVGEQFPGLERHISTQMTVTGIGGASYLKNLGASRIVPARELSLDEIREVREQVDIEIETFIHGAICYCYSGQCLFSSLIGGRSGNRGRCAQPCRLPYKIGKNTKEGYPLSLKDMCTLELLPALIEAGIDSFKIEGRMKSPEYAAGVTAVYRKYLDRYYSNPKEEYRVEENDMELLRSLYMRSEISQGYYYRRGGREMVTLESPGYTGRDTELTARIRAKYLDGDFRLPIHGRAILETGKRAVFILKCGESRVTAEGGLVQQAERQPLSEENVIRQLTRSGNTPFILKNMEVELSPDAFLPVRQLNELRRTACDMLEETLIKTHGLAHSGRAGERAVPGMAVGENAFRSADRKKDSPAEKKQSELHASVLTREQYQAAVREKAVKRIYVPPELCLDADWLEKARGEAERKEGPVRFLAMPSIIRNRDRAFLGRMGRLLEGPVFSGVLVRCLEELQWLKEIDYGGKVVTDANLYIWNRRAAEFLAEAGEEHYLPYELNVHELGELIEGFPAEMFSLTVYGRLPMMVTANCLARTDGSCLRQKPGRMRRQEDGGVLMLTDRYQKVFPVYLNCTHCYNVIYNSLPLSLHGNLEKMAGMGIRTFRLDFTTETGGAAAEIIRFFQDMLTSGKGKLPCRDYTKAHFKRGVE